MTDTSPTITTMANFDAPIAARSLQDAAYDKACRVYYEATLAITAAENAADEARRECERLEKEMGI